jgi:hypothetical protein
MIPVRYHAQGTTSPALLHGGAEELNVRQGGRTPASVRSETFVSVCRSAARTPGRTSLEFAPARPALACPLGRASRAGSQTLEGVAAHQLTEIQSLYPGLRKENRAAI